MTRLNKNNCPKLIADNLKVDEEIARVACKALDENGRLKEALDEEERYLGEGETGQGWKYLEHDAKMVVDAIITYQAQAAKAAPGPLRLPEEVGIERGRKDEKESSPDRRFAAFSEIVAAVMHDDAEIRAFREEVLAGRLLEPVEIPAWLQAIQKKEGTTVQATFSHKRGQKKAIIEQARRYAAGEYFVGLETGRIGLDYPDLESGFVRSLPISATGKLARLKRLAKKYKPFWSEHIAVFTILTGEPLPVSVARTRYKINQFPVSFMGMDRVIVEFSPYLPKNRVMEVVEQARKEGLALAGRQRVKRLTEKHLRLSVFAVKNKRSWSGKMRLWNAEYPKWAYKNRSTFARDCRAAYERVTNWSWRGNTPSA